MDLRLNQDFSLHLQRQEKIIITISTGHKVNVYQKRKQAFDNKQNFKKWMVNLNLKVHTSISDLQLVHMTSNINGTLLNVVFMFILGQLLSVTRASHRTEVAEVDLRIISG